MPTFGVRRRLFRLPAVQRARGGPNLLFRSPGSIFRSTPVGTSLVDYWMNSTTGERAASIWRTLNLISHGKWVGGIGAGPGGHASRRGAGAGDRALGRPGAARRAMGLQAVLAGGASFDRRAGVLGDHSVDRARCRTDKEHSRGQRRHHA